MKNCWQLENDKINTGRHKKEFKVFNHVMKKWLKVGEFSSLTASYGWNKSNSVPAFVTAMMMVIRMCLCWCNWCLSWHLISLNQWCWWGLLYVCPQQWVFCFNSSIFLFYILLMFTSYTSNSLLPTGYLLLLLITRDYDTALWIWTYSPLSWIE